MKIRALFFATAILPALCVSTLAYSKEEQMLKVATFNVSMEATNYKALGMKPSDKVLQHVLSSGEHSQVKILLKLYSVLTLIFYCSMSLITLQINIKG